MALHQRTHPRLDRDDCFGCRVSSVYINNGLTRTLEAKARDLRLSQYARARGEGSKPQGTGGFTGEDFPTQALRKSDELGRPFRADDMVGTLYPDMKEHIAPIDMSASFDE